MSLIEETIDKFLETRDKLADLEKKHEKYRKTIEEYMTSQGLGEIKHNDLILKKSLSTRETVSKKDLPAEIWEKYSKLSRYTMITVKKDKTKKL